MPRTAVKDKAYGRCKVKGAGVPSPAYGDGAMVAQNAALAGMLSEISDRVQINFELDNWATNDFRYKDFTPPGLISKTDIGFFWASRGSRGLWAPWDWIRVGRAHALGETVIQLEDPAALDVGDRESFDSLVVGDRVIFQGNGTIYTLNAVDLIARTVTLNKGLVTSIKNRALMTRGGNWFDRDGVFRGTNHFINQVVNTQVVTVDISEIDGDLFIPFPIRISSAKIDGVPITSDGTDPTRAAFCTGTSFAGGAVLPTASSNGMTFILNRKLRGSVLELTRTSAITQTLIINKVAGPKIRDYSKWNVADTVVNTPDIFDLEVTSEAAVRAAMVVTAPYASNTGPHAHLVLENGLKLLEYTFEGDGPGAWTGLGKERGIKWQKNFTPGLEEVRWQYTWRFKNDATDNNNEGLKLPSMHIQGQGPADMDHHSGSSRGNPHMLGLEDYSWTRETLDAVGRQVDPEDATAQGYGRSAFNVIFRADTLYTIEHHTKLNTPGLKDGIRTILVNGHRVLHLTDYDYRGSSTSLNISWSEIMFFHGGQSTPKGPVTYGIAKIRFGTQYIGKPPEFRPAWVPPAGKVGIVPMVGSLASVNPCPANNCIYSGAGGFTQGQGGIFVESGSEYASEWGTVGGIYKTGGGHNDYGGNESYIFDLDTLTWIRLDNPSTTPDVSADGVAAKQAEQELWPWGDYEDGQPCSLHSYGRHVYLPPSMGGAAPKGSIVRVAGGIYVANNKASHVFNLNAPTNRWSRWGANIPAGGSHGAVLSACIDPVRNRIWLHSYTGDIWYADIATRTFIDEITLASAVKAGPGNTGMNHSIYIAALDKLTVWTVKGAPAGSGNIQVSGWYLKDMNNPSLGFTEIIFSGDPLPITSSSTRQHQNDINLAGNGKLYLVTPADDALFEITPAATPGGVWNVVRMPYSSLTSDQTVIDAWNAARAANDDSGTGKQFRNFSWCSKLGCFVWPYAGGTRAPLCFTPPQ